MKWLRRLGVVSIAVACWGIANVALAQSYPTRPVKIVVPYAPGGNSDVIARIVAERLQHRLKQPFIVENRPGGTGTIGLEHTARSAPDGYTIVFNPGTIAVSQTLLGSALNPVADFTPIINLGITPNVIGGHPSIPVKDMREFVAYVKSNPDKAFYSSCGVGGSQHLAMEAFKLRANVELTQVPYAGCGAPLPDLLSGRVSFFVNALASVSAHAREGNLRLYATTGAKRLNLLPDVPTVAEAGYPDFIHDNWLGAFGPAKIPPEIVSKLNKEIDQIIKLPDVVEKFNLNVVEPVGGPPEVIAKQVADDVERYGRLVKSLGIGKLK